MPFVPPTPAYHIPMTHSTSSKPIKRLSLLLNFGLAGLLLLAGLCIFIQRNEYAQLESYAQRMKTFAQSTTTALIGQHESKVMAQLGAPKWTKTTAAGAMHTWHVASRPGVLFPYEQEFLIEVDSDGIIRSVKMYETD
jgi:hypothetical protein